MGKVFGFTPDYLVRLPLADESGNVVEELVEYNVCLNVPIEVRDGYGNVLTYEYVRMTHDGEMRLSYGSRDREWFDLRDAFSEADQYDVQGMYALCVAGREHFADRTSEGMEVMMRGQSGMDPYGSPLDNVLEGLFNRLVEATRPENMNPDFDELNRPLFYAEKEYDPYDAERLRLSLEKFMENSSGASLYPINRKSSDGTDDGLFNGFGFIDRDSGDESDDRTDNDSDNGMK